jgi:hypothetical protein
MVQRWMTGRGGAGARWCAAILLLAFAACSEEKSTGPDGDDLSPFTLGRMVTVPLSLPGGAHWDDPVSGLRFVFPEGAEGTLGLAPIVDGPARPWPGGTGCYVSFTGSEPVRVRMPHETGGLECLLAYGTPRGSWNDGPHVRWFAVPVATPGATDSIDLPLALRPRSGSEICESSHYYWQVRFSAGAPTLDSLNAAIETAQGFLAAWLDSLDEPQREECHQRMEGALAPTFFPDGSYYAGFFRGCGESPVAMARIGLRPGASRGEIAHQVGHYVTHLLAGDEAYATLEENAAPDPTIGRERYDRSGVIDDYARYHEHLFTGAVEGAGDPAAPATFFAPQGPPPSPEAVDVPSLQGYGVLLLHALGRRDSTMTCLTGETGSVPIVGMRYAELAQHVISRGAGSIDGLRQVVETYLASIGQAQKLPILAAATGWCYRGSGVIVDRSGAKVPGIFVRDLISVDGRYRCGFPAPAVTDSAGVFRAHGLFGGRSLLRATVAGDSFDTSIAITWLKHTPADIELPNWMAWPYLDRLERLRLALELDFATPEGDTLSFSFNQVLADSNAVFAPTRIYIESPFAFPCAGASARSSCWVLDSLQIRYDLARGTVEDLRFRIHDLDPRPTRFSLRLREPVQAILEGTKKVHFVRMTGVDAAEPRTAFAMELDDRNGVHCTEADLYGDDLWIEVRAYCG